MKLFLTISILFLSLNGLGQHAKFLKTIGKKNPHFIEFSNNIVKVYKMGRYYDHAGAGPAIIQVDTLLPTNQNELSGKFYKLVKTDTTYTLLANMAKELETEHVNQLKANTALNNAYYLKSYFDLSHKLNNEFPLYHNTFRNAYYAWEKCLDKTIGHDEFIIRTDQEISKIYDSISAKQTAFTKTTNFITNNSGQKEYIILKDSLSNLSIDYRPNSAYFDKSVYSMSKSNPAYFYKLLQDFPKSKKFIYYAVKHDKELVKELKQVKGYDELKKEFLKEYNLDKSMAYRTTATYVVFGGLLLWLIIAQP